MSRVFVKDINKTFNTGSLSREPTHLTLDNGTTIILFTLAWILAVIAGAGPSFEKNEVSTYKITTPIVILLDASNKMTGSDIAPNRFDRAKFKIKEMVLSTVQILKLL